MGDFGTKSGRVPSCDSQCGVIHGVNGKSGSSCSNLENLGENVKFKVAEEKTNNSRLSSVLPASDLSEKVVPGAVCCDSCSSLIGAYPCANGDMPVDDGVRLFKCYISTSLPVGGSADLFRKYSLQRMFTSQLVESAKDELSFRTVVRDLRTKSPMLQIVLVNPNSWCCSDCSSYTKSQLRVLEDWVTKNLADEVFMLAHLIEELIETIKSAKVEFPSSCTFLQGLSFASMPR
ncbi:hypothetical protein OIU77_003516 [Salix suchowensis]|uniref:Uncharacterized protein n=1 Tax=Salix suchowensis TaxID=1278906 RepID=A0ABQ9B055_9ROSI|nr:hypothetical protein OIU77_003516 [Salix suchowensis]